MRVFTDEHLQLLVSTPELDVEMLDVSDLSLQLLNLRLEASDLVRQAISRALLSIRLRSPAQCLMTEGLREQLKESV
jgi:hypothetical protein